MLLDLVVTARGGERRRELAGELLEAGDHAGALAAPQLDGLPKKKAEAFALLIDSILALMRENKPVLWGSMIKETMKRKKPSFNEGYYGYSTFSDLLEDAERANILKLRRDRRAGTYVVEGFARSR